VLGRRDKRHCGLPVTGDDQALTCPDAVDQLSEAALGLRDAQDLDHGALI
jgi:hypothetical protein